MQEPRAFPDTEPLGLRSPNLLVTVFPGIAAVAREYFAAEWVEAAPERVGEERLEMMMIVGGGEGEYYCEYYLFQRDARSQIDDQLVAHRKVEEERKDCYLS